MSVKIVMAELREQLKQATVEVNGRREKVLEKRMELRDTDVSTHARDSGYGTIQLHSKGLSCCRTLEGHTGKIYSLEWAHGQDRIVSASQDGYLIVWNALTSQKIYAFKLACSWVMTCAISPSGHTVACGGLDSVCSVYTLRSQQGSTSQSCKILSGHTSYVSCCKFLPDHDNQLLSSSGDRTCILWDLQLGQKVHTFGGSTSAGHCADVMSLSISSTNSQQFVSGSCDRTARLWDIRTSARAVQTYNGHDADVNTVQFFPDGLQFGTGSDDSTCRIFDTRMGHELQQYKHPNQTVKAYSIAFSHSGRLFFAAYSNADCYVWDTLTAQVVSNIKRLPDSHKKLVSCIGLASDGSALCTGSWDKCLKIWVCNSELRRI